jgi:membrane-associated phospholipid phosphatase
VSAPSLTRARLQVVCALLVAIALIALSMLADGWVAEHVRYGKVYERDWGRMLRTFGYLPFWLLAALGLALHRRPAAGWWRGGALLAGAPTLAGMLAELLKLAVRRGRPQEAAGYLFRAWSDHPLSTRGFGFPSSHAVVAFAAAAILARLFPRGRVVWYATAAGCAFSRLLAHAHFFSDVVAAALLGIGVAMALWSYASPRTEAAP